MEKHFRGCFVFCLIFTFVSILTVSSNAGNNESFSNLEVQLGILTGGAYTNTNISNIAEGSVIEAQVFDPSKIGDCQAGDKVELKKLGHDRWTVTHLATGRAVLFSIKYEEGILKVAKIGSLSNKDSQADYRPTRYEKPYYFAFKGGIYEATDDLKEFDTAFYGEIAFNQYLTPNFAVEVAVGYFKLDYSESGSLNGVSYSGDIDIYAIPITANLKGVIPFKIGEFYAGAGIGGYYVDGEIDVGITGYGSYSADDSDFIIGGQLLAGLSFDITDTVLIGVEGKYIFTDEAKISMPQVESGEFNLNGYTITGVLGFRF